MLPWSSNSARWKLNKLFLIWIQAADGMTAGFYQKYWDIVGDDVISAVQNFFQNGQMLRSFNHTQIVLIPKIRTPTQVLQFRPISLCNVFYKIIAKALANRLHNVLPNLISLNQSAFVKNRHISDNILNAQELVHFLKNKKSGRDGHMAWNWISLRRMTLSNGPT